MDVHSVLRCVIRTQRSTCRSVLMCKFYKFYICAVVGVIIEKLDNMHGVTTKIKKTFITCF